jgi:hypothetical protein
MPTPTFNETRLVSRAAQEALGSPQVRLQLDTLPGVHGRYAQLHGTSGREIVVRGVLHASSPSPAEANAGIKAALRSKQALADGATVGDYVGTDGVTYRHCVVTDYRATGEVLLSPGAGVCDAMIPVEARLSQLV